MSRVVRQVAGQLEEVRLGDVRGVDELEALLDVPTADVVLHLPRMMPPFGWKTGEAAADLLGEGEQVELGAELAVVALGGLLEAVLVRAQLVLGRPRGAVDALQLRVLLRAAPVGGGDAR